MKSDQARDSKTPSPSRAKDQSELLDVLDGSLSDHEDGILEPCKADRIKFFVEEGLSELLGQHWELLDHAVFDSPVFVLRKFSQTWNDGLLKILNPNHLVQIVKSLEKIQSDT